MSLHIRDFLKLQITYLIPLTVFLLVVPDSVCHYHALTIPSCNPQPTTIVTVSIHDLRLLLVLICLLLWQYDEVEAGTQDRGSREVIRKYISLRMTIITTLPYKSYGIEVAIKTY